MPNPKCIARWENTISFNPQFIDAFSFMVHLSVVNQLINLMLVVSLPHWNLTASICSFIILKPYTEIIWLQERNCFQMSKVIQRSIESIVPSVYYEHKAWRNDCKNWCHRLSIAPNSLKEVWKLFYHKKVKVEGVYINWIEKTAIQID